jgi:hypothetical protein
MRKHKRNNGNGYFATFRNGKSNSLVQQVTGALTAEQLAEQQAGGLISCKTGRKEFIL